MGITIPRLLILKQLISNSTLNTLSNLPTIHIRRCTQISAGKSLVSKVMHLVSQSPRTSAIPLIEQYAREGYEVRYNDLHKIIHILRKKNHLARALEVSEWTISHSIRQPNSTDFAVQLNLIGMLHGIVAAEKFFSEVNDHSEKMYGALLNCYVKAGLVEKSLTHFNKMKDMGLAMNSLHYNNIMTLYMNIGQSEKVHDLLLQMEDNGVYPDEISYRICLQSFVSKSDFNSTEKLLKIMESHPRVKMDWCTYATVANYYIDGRCNENALYYLHKAERILRDNAGGYHNLITMYAKLGDVSQVLRLWRKQKTAGKAQTNMDYMVIIGSLVKLDELQEAEKILEEWESSGMFYDFRVPNILLIGYTQKGLVETAEKMVEGIINKGKTPVPNTWSIISAGHIKCGNMNKALECMKIALEKGPNHQGWLPKPEVVSSILKWLSDSGDFGEVDEFLKLLRGIVNMDQNLLERMKAGNIDIDEEMSNILRSRIQS